MTITKKQIMALPLPIRLVERLEREMRRPTLTERQLDVLACKANGMGHSEIAELMHLSRSTVDDHSKAAIAALGARNAHHAIALALVRGDLDPELIA